MGVTPMATPAEKSAITPIEAEARLHINALREFIQASSCCPALRAERTCGCMCVYICCWGGGGGGGGAGVKNENETVSS